MNDVATTTPSLPAPAHGSGNGRAGARHPDSGTSSAPPRVRSRSSRSSRSWSRSPAAIPRHPASASTPRWRSPRSSSDSGRPVRCARPGVTILVLTVADHLVLRVVRERGRRAQRAARPCTSCRSVPTSSSICLGSTHGARHPARGRPRLPRRLDRLRGGRRRRDRRAVPGPGVDAVLDLRLVERDRE